jgi:hypothetical protein
MFPHAEMRDVAGWLIELDMHVSRVERGVVEHSCI